MWEFTYYKKPFVYCLSRKLKLEHSAPKHVCCLMLYTRTVNAFSIGINMPFGEGSSLLDMDISGFRICRARVYGDSYGRYFRQKAISGCLGPVLFIS